MADMDAGASPNQHKNRLYFNTRRLYRCHAFGNHCKTQWKSMVLNLACFLVTGPIVVFSSCNMLHIFPMYFEHVVSCRFGVQTTLDPYASLLSLLQTALAHETSVRVTFGARRRNTYFCRCHGYSTITFFTLILGASFLPTPFAMWFGGHSATAMSGLCDVDCQRWPLRMPSLPASLDS